MCFSNDELPFPRLPNYIRTEIEFFLAEVLKKAKELYRQYCFQEEKKKLLKTLDQKEEVF